MSCTSLPLSRNEKRYALDCKRKALAAVKHCINRQFKGTHKALVKYNSTCLNGLFFFLGNTLSLTRYNILYSMIPLETSKPVKVIDI